MPTAHPPSSSSLSPAPASPHHHYTSPPPPLPLPSSSSSTTITTTTTSTASSFPRPHSLSFSHTSSHSHSHSSYRFPSSSSTAATASTSTSSSLIYSMEHRSHPSHWHSDRSLHVYNDRPRKDPEPSSSSSSTSSSYHSSLTDPYYPRSSSTRQHSPSSHQHDYYYHRQQQHRHEYNDQQHYRQNHLHHSQHYRHQPENASYRNGDQVYGRRGHRYSTDSAAADTLLMLSSAAFMDPISAQSAMDTTGESESVDREDHYGSGRHSHSNVHAPPHTHTTYTHHHSDYSRLTPMSKTVSAPASSSLYQSRQHSFIHQQQHQQRDHSQDMDIERPSPSNPSSIHSVSHTIVKREPSPVKSSLSFHHRPSSPLTSSAATNAAANTTTTTTTAATAASVNVSLVTSTVAQEKEGEEEQEEGEEEKEEKEKEKETEKNEKDSNEMQVDAVDTVVNKKAQEDEDNDEEGEDEVMSEGVVHMNAVSLPSKTKPKSHPIPTISTSASTLQQHSNHESSPKTPTSARTPRTPKQTKAPKLPKTPRQITNRGKSNHRDSYGDYFYSPFPPSASPASSPSSPSSLQAQLQLLTHNFVSIQPHSSPTNRFRRIPSSIITATPPFSPPASPGLDLARDSPFHPSAAFSKAGNTDDQNGPPTTPTSGSFLRPSSKVTTPMRSHFKPRWHTQPYMMFLALRAMPNRTAARQELIMAAVELDKKFSAEKGLPRVFTGKTPMNSASACLTNNGDKYFIPFKPEGSRSTHFRLAYEPGDFDTAVKEYNKWMEQLVQRDWPLCFGIPREGAIPVIGNDHVKRLRFDENEEKEVEEVNGKEDRPEIQRAYSSPESRKRGHDLGEQENKFGNSKKAKADSDSDDVKNGEDKRVANKMKRLDIGAAGSYDGPLSCPPTPTAAFAAASLSDHSPPCEDVYRIPKYRLEDLDLDTVPSGLAEVVRVDVSTVPNSGNGLFAKIDLPVGTPLGFYFGVPMTENEFDSLKDGVGLASQYSIMYRRTVLDATDDHGQPYTDLNGPIYCPFHFMNEDSDGNVSFLTGSVVNQVICITNRDVKAGEELFVFYGKEMDRHWGMATQGQDLPTNGEAGMDGKRSRGGSRSRASSPTRRAAPAATAAAADDTRRPRRETVHKPLRYSR